MNRRFMGSGLLLSAIALFFLYSWVKDDPRDYLTQHYATVGTVKFSWRPFKCTAQKGRSSYDFTATRADGSTVTGYVCYTRGGLKFLTLDPVIHED